MNRSIKLTRIHAINWYGYSNSTLQIHGNTLFAGRTGSGKSVLMDLVMTVLVGTDVAHNHFNRSATGSRSDRTLRSYCLLDTKREENGQPQYQRSKGAITYIALEFEWPVQRAEEPRVETWGLRVEFRNASETQPRITPFYCKGQLSKADFLAAKEPDGKLFPREQGDFKRHIESTHTGRLFDTQEQYLRDMANEEHLNFHRDVFKALLPQAMSFTNSKSFDVFIRDFVLPTEDVNVADVATSYRSFLAYEHDLRDLHDQLERLLVIQGLNEAQLKADRDAKAYDWLAAESGYECEKSKTDALRVRLDNLQRKYADEQDLLEKLTGEIATITADVERLKNLIREAPGGPQYLFMQNEGARLKSEIAMLGKKKAGLDGELQSLVERARAWIGRAGALGFKEQPLLGELDSAITILDGCEFARTDRALREMLKAIDTVRQVLDEHVRPFRSELEEARKKTAKLGREIGALQLGELPSEHPLLHALNAAIPKEGRSPAAIPLSKLCEVTDEKWRAAIEVAFDRKFAIVVNEGNYSSAMEVYRAFRSDSPSESLIVPFRAKAGKYQAQTGSIAEKLSTNDPVVRAIIDLVFGEVQCVTSEADLMSNEKAIMSDGFMVVGPVASRPRHFDGLPFIGERGLQLQLDIKRAERREVDANVRSLEERVDKLDALKLDLPRPSRGEHEIYKAIGEVGPIEGLTEKLRANEEALRGVDKTGLDEKFKAQNVQGEKLVQLNQQRDGLQRSQVSGDIARIRGDLQSAESLLSSASARFEETKDKLASISIDTALCDRLRNEVTERIPNMGEAAKEFDRLSAHAMATGERKRTELIGKREVFLATHPKHNELETDNPSNAEWEKLLGVIEGARIPDYKQKANDQKRIWENLFRTQVLQKVDRALKNLRDIISLLNTLLKTPIGNDRYSIVHRANPAFKGLQKLVELNSLHQEDELFYQAVEGELQDELKSFLQLLIDKPDSTEAVRSLDYRSYFDYDLNVHDATDPEAKPQSVDKQSGKMSGGENQSPYFVAILASYLRAYKRHDRLRGYPSLALVPIDEAFSKMDTGRIADCINAIKQLELQGLFSMSAGNVPSAFAECDQLIIVNRNERPDGQGRLHISNIPVSILKDSAEARELLPQLDSDLQSHEAN